MAGGTLAEAASVPVTCTLMGLGGFPGLDKIIFRGKIFCSTNIPFTIMGFDIIQGFECTQITPRGFKNDYSHFFRMLQKPVINGY